MKAKPRFAVMTCGAVLSAAPALAQTPPGPIPPAQQQEAPAAAPSDTGSATPASPEAPIADVVVTSNRRAQRERDVAGSVSAITGEDLTRRQQVRIQDLAGTVPGLSLEEGTPTQTRVILRGINSGSPGATAGVVVDDVPVNSASSLNNGALVTPNPDTYDLQRIEVLRGPQGTLYGATAEGGLLKYVTNPPDLRTYSGSVEGGLNGVTGGGLGGLMRGYVNVPIVKDKVAVRLSVTNEYLPGFIDNFEKGKSNINSAQQVNWRASLLAKPDTRLSVRLYAARQTIYSNDLNSVQVRGAALNPANTAGQLNFLDPLQKNARFASNSQLETSLYYGQANYDVGGATLTSLTSYGYNKLGLNADLTNYNLAAGVPFSTGLVGATYGAPGNLVQRQNNDTSKFNQEVRLSSNPGSALAGFGLDWQGGFYFTHETNQLRQFLNPYSQTPPFGILSNPTLGGSALTSRYSEWATFGQFTLHVTPRISIDVGGRFAGNTQSSQVQTFCCVAYGPTAAQPYINSNDHVGLYNVAPKWQFDDNTLLYARVATGYRPGGPNLPVPGVTGIPRTYTSDNTTNYEVGIRRDLFNKKVQVDVTGFYVDWQKIQVASIFQTSAGPLGTTGNAGAAVSKGIEWTLNWAPLPGLRLGAAGSYTDARLTTNAPGLGGASGDYLPYVPSVVNGVNVDYFWEPINDYQAFVSGTAAYVGQRYTSFTTTPFANNHTSLPGYVTGSIRAGIEHNNLGLEAFINNISSTRGITFYQNYGGANQTGIANVIQPRQIGAVLRAKF